MDFKSFFRLDEMAARRSLYRNLSKFGDEVKKPVAILTAFLNGSEPLSRLVANRKHNRSLLLGLSKYGLSHHPVGGVGQEEKEVEGGGKVVSTSEEESYVVQPRGEMDEEMFLAIVRKLISEYNQYAAAVKLPSEPQAFLLQPNGERTAIGSGVAPRGSDDEYFTQLHAGPRAGGKMLSPGEAVVSAGRRFAIKNPNK